MSYNLAHLNPALSPGLSVALSKVEGLVYAFSSRASGNMSLFYGDTEDSLENRKTFLKDLGIDYRSLVCAQQVHASQSRFIQEVDKGRGALSYTTAIPGTDALITRERNLPLAVFTADCLSIFIYDRRTPAIGLVHAGWRGSRDHILGKTVKLMQEKFNSQVKDLSVSFGPAIGSCCYAVREDFSDFSPRDLIKRNNRYYLDLPRINKRQLLDSGVKEKNIFDPQICTSCRNGEFFSYRKEGKACGRMMSVMMLK